MPPDFCDLTSVLRSLPSCFTRTLRARETQRISGPRCSFVGRDGGVTAKADFAIPSKEDPRIIIEAKGYAATGSKQTDVLGDLRQIITTKHHDTALLFVTDGLTWRQRKSDLRKIVEMQNRGEITRIYTRSMRDEFGSDLQTLKSDLDL